MDIEKVRNLLKIEVANFDTLEDVFRACEAMWTYHGYKDEPHAVLTSDKHSDGYYHVGKVLQFPHFRTNIALMAFTALGNMGIGPQDVDFLISSSNAARPFGEELGAELDACGVFTEKVGGEQRWTGRFEIPEGAKVLQAEELVTTIGTTQKVHKALEENPHSVESVAIDGKPVVITIVHRPTKLPKTYLDFTVVSLMEKEIQAWKPDECPICRDTKGNSPALPFKANRATFMEFEMRFAKENAV